MNSRYPGVASRAGHRCEYCHAPEVIFNLPFEVDHIQPVALQGGNDDENLALSCRHCNLRKGAHTHGTDPQSGEGAPLFDPRTDSWDDHFNVDEPSFQIVGKTEIGRATVDKLGMNRPLPLRARRHWATLGIFP
jgi:HNH endonuclease